MDFSKTSLIVGNLLLLPAQLAGQEQGVLGQGNVSCASWLEKRQDDVQVAARTAWILGYITAFNQYGSKLQGDISGGRDTPEITAWIDNYCKQHSADDVYRASAALVEEFNQRGHR